MSEIVEILFMILMEMLVCMQCVQIAFRQNPHLDKYMLGIALVYYAICIMVNFGNIPDVLTYLFYIIMYFYCYYKFQMSKKETLVKVIMAFIMTATIEGVAMVVVHAENNISYVIGVTAFAISYFVRKVLNTTDENRVLTQKKLFAASMIICGMTFMFVMLDFRYRKTRFDISMLLMLLLVLLMFLCLYMLDRANTEIKKKDYELELQHIYGGAYEELLTEVRRRQHDFKNQIGAIYSMHMVAKSYEELVDMQRQYADELQYDCRYDSMLTRCNNTILAGYLYYRCIACEKEHIEVVYEISVDKASCSFAIHEIIEILGILVDNACESFGNTVETEKLSVNGETTQCETVIKNKNIRLTFREDDDSISFSVANPTEYKSFDEIETMFRQGYSSKGKNRGIGLDRVRELVNQHKAQIKVENVTYEDVNWLEFMVEIQKG